MTQNRTEYMRKYMKKYRRHQPKSAHQNKEMYAFWKSLDGLTVEDMVYLITIRKRDMKHKCDILQKRTEIAILRDAIRIAKAQNETQE